MGKTTQEIADMQSKGQIGYKEITDALKLASSEGGRFYKAMERQSNTFNGMISNFQDNLGNLTGSLTSSFTEALKRILKPLNEVIDRINELLQNNRSFQALTNMLVSFGERVGNALKNLSDKQLNSIIDFAIALTKSAPIMGVVGTALTKLNKPLTSLISSISEATKPLSNILSLIPGFGPIIGGLINSVGDLGATILVFVGIFTGITAIVGILGHVNNQTNNKLYEMSVTFRQKAPEIVKGFVDRFNDVLPMIVTQGQAIIRNLVTGISQMLPSLLSAVKNILKAIADTMKKNGRQIARTFTDMILGLAEVLIDCLPDFIEGTYEILIGIMQSIMINAPKIIQAMADCMEKTLQVALDKEDEFLNYGVEIIEAILNGIISAMPTIIRTLPTFIERMIQVFTTNIRLFIEVGSLLIEGLVRGLIIAIPEINKYIPEIISAVINGFKRGFGINSPSTVFQEIGYNLIQGLINGINNMIGSLTSKLWSIVNQVTGIFNNLNLWNTGYNMIQGLINGMQNRKSVVEAMARDIARGASTALSAFIKEGSPSKLFQYHGEMTSLGYAIGIENESDEVQEKINSMFNLQPNVSPTMTYVEENPLQSMFTNFLNNMQERPVEIEVRADEGIIVQKATQGFREFQRANGRLPF